MWQQASSGAFSVYIYVFLLNEKVIETSESQLKTVKKSSLRFTLVSLNIEFLYLTEQPDSST